MAETTEFCAFDIEIVKEIPAGVADWKTIRPLGISCAATACSNSAFEYVTHYHKDENGEPAEGAMTPEEVGELVDRLLYMDEQGYTIVTWNGLGFDFDVLAEESGRWQECRDLALRHVDMMFHFLCRKGFPLGLNTAAHGLGLPGKTEGMHGDLAPVMWAKSLDDRKKVLEYVAQDAVTTLQVAEKAEDRLPQPNHNGDIDNDENCR